MDDRHEPDLRDDDGRKGAIIEAASRVFTEKGFSGASNREIAREAGISPGLIYWYFRDKEELFRAVLQRMFPLHESQILPDGVDDLSLHELLTLLGQQFIRVLTRQDVLRLMRLGMSELIRFPDVVSEAGQLTGSRVIEPLAQQLEMRIERGEIQPIDTWLAAQAFFGSLVGYVLRKHMYQSADLQDVSHDQMVTTVVRVYAAGLSTFPDKREKEE